MSTATAEPATSTLRLSEKDISRFWSKVRKGTVEECWDWMASTNEGYGQFHVRSKGRNNRLLAHRVSFALHNGPITSDVYILHKCDNPKCCNPDHLFPGTAKDNALDAKSKKRHCHGVKHGCHRLTEDQVREMRALHGLGITQVELAKRFGVRQGHVTKVVRCRSWSHILTEASQ